MQDPAAITAGLHLVANHQSIIALGRQRHVTAAAHELILARVSPLDLRQRLPLVAVRKAFKKRQDLRIKSLGGLGATAFQLGQLGGERRLGPGRLSTQILQPGSLDPLLLLVRCHGLAPGLNVRHHLQRLGLQSTGIGLFVVKLRQNRGVLLVGADGVQMLPQPADLGHVPFEVHIDGVNVHLHPPNRLVLDGEFVADCLEPGPLPLNELPFMLKLSAYVDQLKFYVLKLQQGLKHRSHQSSPTVMWKTSMLEPFIICSPCLPSKRPILTR
jgi:hypothetical protein